MSKYKYKWNVGNCFIIDVPEDDSVVSELLRWVFIASSMESSRLGKIPLNLSASVCIGDGTLCWTCWICEEWTTLVVLVVIVSWIPLSFDRFRFLEWQNLFDRGRSFKMFSIVNILQDWEIYSNITMLCNTESQMMNDNFEVSSTIIYMWPRF